jgi:hypothetical protein
MFDKFQNIITSIELIFQIKTSKKSVFVDRACQCEHFYSKLNKMLSWFIDYVKSYYRFQIQKK